MSAIFYLGWVAMTWGCGSEEAFHAQQTLYMKLGSAAIEASTTEFSLNEGDLAGTKVAFSAGTLNTGSTIEVGKISRPGIFKGVGGAEGSRAISISAKDVNGTPINSVTSSLTVSLPLGGLSLAMTTATEDDLCVLLDPAADTAPIVWRRSAITVAENIVSVKSMNLGVFQAVYCGKAVLDGFAEYVAPDESSSSSSDSFAISLASPYTAIDYYPQPKFTVTGLTVGSTLKIYKDACETEAGSVVVSSSTMTIQSTSVDVGAYTFYAQETSAAGVVGSCTSAGVSYTRQSNIAFVSVWRTTGPNETITLPLREADINGTMSYNFTVSWGDGNSSEITSWNDSDKQHQYANAGDYTVTITGYLDGWYFNNGGDKAKLISISNFGYVGFKNLEGAFYGCSALTSVSGGDTRFVTSMRNMFANAANATPDTSNWNVANVSDMSYMFYGADAATPTTTDWNVSSVTSMSNMFYSANQANPTVTNWNVANVTSMSGMFDGAVTANPTTTSWNVAKVTNLNNMFRGATSANPNVASWDVSAVTTMQGMFSGATSATPSTSQWNTSLVTDMRYMFKGATSANPDTSNWQVSKVTNMSNMFRGATSANPNTSNWDLSSLTDGRYMFYGATSANPVTVNWELQNVTDMRYMFYGATSANPVTTSWDVSKVSDMRYMFYGATSANPDTTSWEVSNVTDMRYMFYGATSANPTVTNWDVSNVMNLSYFFYGATSAAPNMTNWDVSRVVNMSYMFRGATTVNPDLTNWDMSSVNNTSYMFYGATSANPTVTNWDVSKVTNMSFMFYGATSANPTVTSWDVSQVTNMSEMFRGATSAAPVVTNWNVGNVTNMSSMFNGASQADPVTSSWNLSLVNNMNNALLGSGIAKVNYSKFLINIAADIPALDATLGAPTQNQYCSSGANDASAALNTLTSTNSWTISSSDGGGC